MKDARNGKFTLVMSYNDVTDFPDGSYGNGRVVVKTFEASDFAKSGHNPMVGFSLVSDMSRELTDAYVYIGNFDSEDDQRVRAFKAMLSVAYHKANEDRTKIHLVGCNCRLRDKQSFARTEGFDFIEAKECGGHHTLAQIVREKLAELPAEPTPITTPELETEFVSEESGKYESSCYFSCFAAIGEVIFAGRADGQVFWNRNGSWEETGLKLEQGVNEIFPDGDRVLVGDGSCCNGDTWSLGLDGQIEQIIPIEGQGCGENQDHLQGNVYGFARRGNELIVGVGGCDGEHIYRLNQYGKWEYHPLDQGRYACVVFTAEDGTIYLTLTTKEGAYDICKYDGQSIVSIAQVGNFVGVGGMIGWNGTIFVGNTDSGWIHPTNRSIGYIYSIKDGRMTTAWKGNGGVSGFFVYNEKLYAFGQNHVDYSTTLLVLIDDVWQTAATFKESLHFFEHNGVVYAGGKEKISDEKARAAIYRVAGL